MTEARPAGRVPLAVQLRERLLAFRAVCLGPGPERRRERAAEELFCFLRDEYLPATLRWRWPHLGPGVDIEEILARATSDLWRRLEGVSSATRGRGCAARLRFSAIDWSRSHGEWVQFVDLHVLGALQSAMRAEDYRMKRGAREMRNAFVAEVDEALAEMRRRGDQRPLPASEVERHLTAVTGRSATGHMRRRVAYGHDPSEDELTAPEPPTSPEERVVLVEELRESERRLEGLLRVLRRRDPLAWIMVEKAAAGEPLSRHEQRYLRSSDAALSLLRPFVGLV